MQAFTHLHLSIGPARHLNNHVEDGLLRVGIEGYVVERRYGLAVLLDENAVLQGVWGTNLPDGVVGHVCGTGRRSCG